jgi:hypothetical protein
VAELPEGFAGASAAAAMGAMSHSVSNAQCLDEERRHARGQAVGLGFLGWKWLKNSLPRVGQDLNHPSGSTSFATTSLISTFSERAAKVSAMRCLSTGSARSITSSMEGASRPSISAFARTASISA